ncbi:PcfJ domain-containing protein, partial [Escherichia coli]|nr:PcfJ domain-containing protein [Escherichia coli]
IKNKVDFNYYMDYLSMIHKLSIPLDSENIIIPQNLVTAHDNAVILVNQLKYEGEEKKYKGRFEKIKNYGKV